MNKRQAKIEALKLAAQFLAGEDGIGAGGDVASGAVGDRYPMDEADKIEQEIIWIARRLLERARKLEARRT